MISTVTTVALTACKGVCVTGAAFWGAPVLIWGSGAIESSVRASLDGVASVGAACLLQRQTAGRLWRKMKADGKVGLGCGIMAGISVIPLAGSYYGYKAIGREIVKYLQVKHAFEQAKAAAQLDRQQALAQMMEKTSGLCAEELEQRVNEQVRSELEVREEHIKKEHRLLEASVIHRHYVHYGMYHGVKGALIACKKALSSGLLKRAYKFTESCIDNAVSLMVESAFQEFIYTADLTRAPKHLE